MNENLRCELNFLIAKYLEENFPDIGDKFIEKCQEKKVLPRGVFYFGDKYEDVGKKLFPNIDSNHIYDVLSLVSSSSVCKSFIFRQKGTEIGKVKDNFKKIKADCFLVGEKLENQKIYRPLQYIDGHFDMIDKLIIDKTSQILLSGSGDSLVKVWKLPEFNLMLSLSAHSCGISSLLLHPSNRFVITSDVNGVCTSSLEDGLFKKRIKITKAIDNLQVSCSDDGECIILSSDTGVIQIHRPTKDGLNIESIPEKYFHFNKNDEINFVRLSKCGKILVVSTDISHLIVVDVRLNRAFFKTCFNSLPYDAVFSPVQPATMIVMSKEESYIILLRSENSLFDIKTELSPPFSKSNPSRIKFAQWSHDGTLVFGVTEKYTIIWKVCDGSVFKIFDDDRFSDVCSIMPHPVDHDLLFVGQDSGRSIILNIRSGQTILDFSKIESPITSASWSPDGQFLYVAYKCGGITQIGPNKMEFKSTDQYFSRELNINNGDKSKIVDRYGDILAPQPKIYKINSLYLCCKMLCQNSIDEELINKSEWVKFSERSMKSVFCLEYNFTKVANKKTRDIVCESDLDEFLYLTNETESGNSDSNIIPEWMFMTKHEQHTYFPQMGDEVVYFKSGHQKFLAECNDLMYLIPPYEIEPSLPDILTGIVTSMSFHTHHILLTIRFTDCNLESKLVFTLPDSPPFLIPKWRYRNSMTMLKKLSEGSIVKVPYSETTGMIIYDAEIERIKSSFRSKPFGCISVNYVDGGDQCYISPWEIQYEEERPQSPITIQQIEYSETFKQLSTVHTDLYEMRSQYELSQILSLGLYPVDLKLICDRFKNGFYNSVNHITMDFSNFLFRCEMLGIYVPHEISSLNFKEIFN